MSSQKIYLVYLENYNNRYICILQSQAYNLGVMITIFWTLITSLLLFQNGDGFISAKELGVLMRTLGRNPTEDEIMNIMNEIDVDHNGKLDFSEFTIMMRDKLSGEDMEQEIKQAFRYVKAMISCSIKLIRFYLILICFVKSDKVDFNLIGFC